MNTFRLRQRGVGLIEPMIAIVILSFGILGLARFQLNMVGQAADSKARLTATQYADELLAQVRVDPASAGCYVTVAAGCTNTQAQAAFTAWSARALAALPANPAKPPNVLVELNQPIAGQLRARLSWTSKGATDTHTHEVITDARP